MGVETIIDDHDLGQDQGRLVNHGGHTSDEEVHLLCVSHGGSMELGTRYDYQIVETSDYCVKLSNV
jgi:hypothetical protein